MVIFICRHGNVGTGAGCNMHTNRKCTLAIVQGWAADEQLKQREKSKIIPSSTLSRFSWKNVSLPRVQHLRLIQGVLATMLAN